MVAKKTDISKIGTSFITVTAAILFIYCLTGMTVTRLNANKAGILFGVFVAFIAFYTVARIKDIKTGLIGLLAGVPAWLVSSFALTKAFEAAQKMTIVCFGIMMRFLLWGSICAIVLSVISLICAKRFKTMDAVFAVLAAGFVLRAVMVLFTPLNFHQHDVSGFGAGFQGFHDDYIMYIYENWALPDGDVRDLGQLYHPPLHYILSAVFFKINSVIFPARAGEINVLKTLPFIWSSGLVLFSYKILRHFKLEGAPLIVALCFVCFHPQTIFLAIQVNNDALGLMLFTAAVYLALKWYEKTELTTILFIALSIGCAMMTKLSMGFSAFPVGFLFLAKLVGSVKQKEKKDTVKPGKLMKQFVLFGVLVVPLGLWFPIRNFVEHGTPFTYVFTIDSTAGQDVGQYSAVQRLFMPSAESLKMPFLTMAQTKPALDYNMFLALLKTSVFDERSFDSRYLLTVGGLLLAAACLMVVLCKLSALYLTVKQVRGKNITAGFISLLILCAVLVGCYIKFCFGYPVVCTQAFRYVAPVLPAAGVFLGLTASNLWKKLPAKIVITGLVAVFTVLTFMFYGAYCQYSPVFEMLIKH